ncbi:MAG: sigma-70 family RNA polymerase sigma factor [Acidimicrobiia bacterium]|nr:sigma-70 family RNA polymerase sigma factor [Acidimicrobiia bacterium]
MIAIPVRRPRWRQINEWLLMVTDQVVAAFVATDRDAVVAELFRLEGVRLVRLARLFTDDRNAAEDLVQEAFIRLHRAAHRIKDPARAAQYLRSIVINLARDHNRRGLMSLRHQEAVPSGTRPDAPDDVLVMDDERQRLLEEVRALSPRQRDCLLLRFYLELSESEIAATLDISKNSVKTHCRRGLETLRSRLDVAT